MRLFRLLALLVAGTASAAGYFVSPLAETQAPMTLYVDGALGDDSHDCTASGSAACATIQGAIDKVPRLVKDPVTISVAAGNYTGAIVEGYTVGWPRDRTTGAYIAIVGTMQTTTPATGSASGTATGGTAGSNATFGTLIDSGATWTSNDFKGKYLRIVSGTGANQRKVISSNTATTITVVGTWTAPIAGSTYIVEEPASTCNLATETPASPNSASAAYGSAVNGYTASSGQCFGFWGNSGQQGDAITLRQFKVAPATNGVGVWVKGGSAQVGLRWVTVAMGSNAFGGVLFNRGSNGSITESYLQENTATTAVVAAAEALTTFTVLQSYVDSGANCVQASSGAAITFQQSECTGSSSSGIKLRDGGEVGITTSRIHDMATCVQLLSTNFNRAWSSLSVTAATDFTNCTTTGIDASAGPTAFISLATTVTGSGNGVFLNVARGARAIVGSAVSVTATTEMSIDGSATTFATLRAASPKVVSNANYGTKVFE